MALIKFALTGFSARVSAVVLPSQHGLPYTKSNRKQTIIRLDVVSNAFVVHQDDIHVLGAFVRTEQVSQLMRSCCFSTAGIPSVLACHQPQFKSFTVIAERDRRTRA